MFANIGDLTGNLIFSEKNLPLLRPLLVLNPDGENIFNHCAQPTGCA